MELEVVAAERSLERDRGRRQRCSEQDEGRAEESVPTGDRTRVESETMRPCYQESPLSIRIPSNCTAAILAGRSSMVFLIPG